MKILIPTPKPLHNKKGKFLFNHNPNKIIGKVIKCEKIKKELIVEILLF